MFSVLGPPDAAVLKRPPANLVAFNLAIEAERDLRPSDGVTWQKLLEANGYRAALLQKVQQQTFTIAAQGMRPTAPGIETREGWKAVQKDQTSQATVFSNGCSLERLNYLGFDSFRAEILAACTALNTLFKPSLRTRVGLRYANALSSAEAKTAAYWIGKVEPTFLGAGADERLQADLERALTITDFRDGDLAAQVRGGLQPDVIHQGSVAFAFDIEVFDGTLSEFSVESSMERAKDMNYIARQIFQSVLTPEYYNSLKEAK